MGITLTQTIAGTTMDVTSAGLPGASPGIALRFQLHDGPIALTLTDQELAGRAAPEAPDAVSQADCPTGRWTIPSP